MYVVTEVYKDVMSLRFYGLVIPLFEDELKKVEFSTFEFASDSSDKLRSIVINILNTETNETLSFSSENDFRKFVKSNEVVGVFISDSIYVCAFSKVSAKMYELLTYEGNFNALELGLVTENVEISKDRAYMLYVSNYKYSALDLLIKDISLYGGLDKNNNFDNVSSIVRIIGSKLYTIDSFNDITYVFSISDKRKFLNLVTKGIVLSGNKDESTLVLN